MSRLFFAPSGGFGRAMGRPPAGRLPGLMRPEGGDRTWLSGLIGGRPGDGAKRTLKNANDHERKGARTSGVTFASRGRLTAMEPCGSYIAGRQYIGSVNDSS